MSRWILLLALGLLPGCDVATAALVFSAQDKKSSDDGPLAPVPQPKAEFKVWIAQIADAPAADQAQLDLIATNGNPDSSFWTELGVFTATKIFDPDNSQLPPFNTILIQASSTMNYELDCVEILDGQNTVLEYASGTTWSNLVDFPDEILGPPDGIVAVTNAVGAERAFLFTMYTGPIDRFRINGHEPLAAVPGDIAAVGGYQSFLNERPGGMVIDADGLVHLTLSVGDSGRLARYDLTGAIQTPMDSVEISTDLATAGTHSVALNSAGVIFTSCSIGAGSVQVRRFESDLSPGNLAGFSSGLNSDRVEHNSIAVDGSGNIVVVGGMSSLFSGRNHWRIKLPDTVTGTPIWQSSTSLDNASDTYWHAVTTGANDELFMTGDRFDGTLLGGTNQIYSTRLNSGGGAVWSNEFFEGDPSNDVGHAIEIDSAGNIYVAGAIGLPSARNGILIRYASAGVFSTQQTFAGLSGGNDEILDIAVDPADGSIFAVGYETVTGQGENIWVRKYVYNSNFNTLEPIWSRTHHGGFGNDRALSVAVYGNNVVVAGFETNASAQTKLVLRVYEK